MPAGRLRTRLLRRIEAVAFAPAAITQRALHRTRARRAGAPSPTSPPPPPHPTDTATGRR